MITTDFAPNEQRDDALKAIRVLLNPLSWAKGKSTEKARGLIKRLFFPQSSIHLFLSGRGSLYYLLKSLSLPDNSDVIVQAFTCEAVVLPILELGYTPIYVDINESDFSMNPVDLEKKITSKSKVIILQHTFGLTPEKRSEIIAIARKHKITVIEDLAHGFNPKTFEKDRSKSIKLMSFGRSKAFSSVFGGAVVTDDKVLMTKLRTLEDKLAFPRPGFIFKTLFYKIITPLIKATYHIYLGKALHKTVMVLGLMSQEISAREKSGKFDHNMAFMYPNALATVLVHQLRKYKKTASQRSKNVQKYAEAFQKTTITNPLIRFPLLIENRNQVLREVSRQKITLGKWYDQVVAPKALDLHKIKYRNGSCPVAEEICGKVVNLPTSLTAEEAEKVISVVKKALELQKESK